MPQDVTAFDTMIGSRICHDLASPLGAIANGLELMTLSAPGDGAELALVQDSLNGAKATLEISRLAYGRATADECLGATGLGKIAADYYAAKSRLTLDWQVSGELPRPRAQIAVLGCLAAEQALPRGGALTVRGDARTLQITAHATPPAPDADLWDGVAGKIPLPAPDPRQAHFHMLRRCLAAQGITMTTQLGAEEFVITI